MSGFEDSDAFADPFGDPTQIGDQLAPSPTSAANGTLANQFDESTGRPQPPYNPSSQATNLGQIELQEKLARICADVGLFGLALNKAQKNIAENKRPLNDDLPQGANRLAVFPKSDVNRTAASQFGESSGQPQPTQQPPYTPSSQAPTLSQYELALIREVQLYFCNNIPANDVLFRVERVYPKFPFAKYILTTKGEGKYDSFMRQVTSWIHKYYPNAYWKAIVMVPKEQPVIDHLWKGIRTIAFDGPEAFDQICTDYGGKSVVLMICLRSTLIDYDELDPEPEDEFSA